MCVAIDIDLDQPGVLRVMVSVHVCPICSRMFRAQPPFLRPRAIYTPGDLALLLAVDLAGPDGDHLVGYTLLPKTREVDQGTVKAILERLRTAGINPDEVILTIRVCTRLSWRGLANSQAPVVLVSCDAASGPRRQRRSQTGPTRAADACGAREARGRDDL